MRQHRFNPKLEQRYNEDEPRDESGKWTDGGGGGDGGSGGSESAKPASEESGKGGKGKVSKVSDFDKKGIRLDHDTTLNGAKAEKFLKVWNERVQEAPEDFKKDFIGVPGTMTISYDDHSDKLNVTGHVQDEAGKNIGEYNRQIDLKNNSAYSAYFVMHRNERGGGIGKTLLKSNVAMYQKMGIDKVKVSANIDVGGYAWAKYGYVPTAESWRNISSDIQDKLSEQGARNSHTASGSGYTPEEWDAIGDHDQSQIETAWMRATASEFEDSEIQNWRDGGGALDDAKSQLAENDPRDEDWAKAALETWRDGLKDEASIPYSNDEILAAVSIEYSADGEGRNDPDIGIDWTKLQTDQSQLLLPGIPEAQPLSDKTRDEIVDRLTKNFNDQAEENAQDMDPPSYITENVSDYQGEVWDSMSSRDRYDWAERNGELPEYPVEDDEEATPEPLEVGDPQREALVKLAESSDPKALWAIADSAQGKDLLLGTSWSGVLDLKDKQTMDRFNAYVGK